MQPSMSRCPHLKGSAEDSILYYYYWNLYRYLHFTVPHESLEPFIEEYCTVNKHIACPRQQIHKSPTGLKFATSMPTHRTTDIFNYLFKFVSITKITKADNNYNILISLWNYIVTSSIFPCKHNLSQFVTICKQFLWTVSMEIISWHLMCCMSSINTVYKIKKKEEHTSFCFTSIMSCIIILLWLTTINTCKITR